MYAVTKMGRRNESIVQHGAAAGTGAVRQGQPQGAPGALPAGLSLRGAGSPGGSLHRCTVAVQFSAMQAQEGSCNHAKRQSARAPRGSGLRDEAYLRRSLLSNNSFRGFGGYGATKPRQGGARAVTTSDKPDAARDRHADLHRQGTHAAMDAGAARAAA
jgi:hypothetical protein